ncbi:histone H1 [Abrus precatorius]|uniref:Histone H1 n=1 Tax=Abrus precatorius TaxID=3816 RepID=A0A8B8M1K5_ABRPR|nr:histone H1 [Abrus precatorius]
MSTAGEGDTPAFEKPVEELKAPEESKPLKEKKPRAPREKKPKPAKTASHPPYFQMIKEALMALNEKGGSSPYAIAKYMEEKHKSVLPANFKKILGLQLKNQAARGKLVKIKASYKLSEPAKKEKRESTTRVTRASAEKKEARPKRSRAVTAAATKGKKSEAAKKVTKGRKKVKKTKKVSTPAKPKQPKSIKSPSKRARKATVATA